MYKILPVIFLIFNISLLAQENISTNSDSTTSENIYDNRVHLMIGWFIPGIESSAQLNASGGGVGATVNLEAAFDLPTNRQLFRFSGLYRFNNKSSVDLYYYVLDRSGSNISKDSLVFGDITIKVGASLESFFDVDLFGARYHLSILNEEDIEAGVSAGISFLDVDLGTTATLNNQSVSESYSELLFLPVIGFFNRVKFWDDFTFRDRVDLFALDIDRYNGLLIDLSFSIEYLVYKHLTLGVGYDALTLNVEFDASKSGKLQYEQRGFIFFATILF